MIHYRFSLPGVTAAVIAFFLPVETSGMDLAQSGGPQQAKSKSEKPNKGLVNNMEENEQEQQSQEERF